ncbi:hypothetical protein ACET3Z_006042 [Daucus carota]
MNRKILSGTMSLCSRFTSSSAPPHLLRVGDKLRETRVFSDKDVAEYSKVSGDSNPLHFDSESAKAAGFQDRLVHGLLVASLFPTIISSHFPRAIYVSQNIHFRLPVYVGEEIVGDITAISIREVKNRFITKFSTKCFKDNGELLVIDGEATAVLPTLSYSTS